MTQFLNRNLYPLKSPTWMHSVTHGNAIFLSPYKQLLFWRENLHSAIAMMESIPSRNVWLDSYRRDKGSHGWNIPSCGSVACLGGWVALWPYFRQFGIVADEHSGAPRFSDSNPTETGVASVSKFLFGEFMFGPASEYGFLGGHKRQALNRLKDRLKVVNTSLKPYLLS